MSDAVPEPLRDMALPTFLRRNGLEDHAFVVETPQKHKLGLVWFERVWLFVPYWFPITARHHTCFEFFHVFQKAKYTSLFSGDAKEVLTRRRGELFATTELSGAFALGGASNYWHFMMDFVPRLVFLELLPELRSRPIAVNADLPAALRSLMNGLLVDLGWKGDRIIRVGRGFAAAQGVYVPGRIPRSAAVHLWEKLIPPARPGRPRVRRLFIQRDHARHRLLANQGEVARHLRRRGFITIDPGGMSIQQQIDLFRDAEVIVGVHGAAMTNVLFAPRDCLLIELYGGLAQPFFPFIADLRGFEYVSVRGATVEQGSKHSAFEIDIGLLDRALSLAGRISEAAASTRDAADSSASSG